MVGSKPMSAYVFVCMRLFLSCLILLISGFFSLEELTIYG